MPLPVPGFMDAGWRNNDFNQVKTVNDTGTFDFFEISHPGSVDAFFLLVGEPFRRSGTRGMAAGFDFNKRQNAAIAGNDVNFPRFDFVVPAENIAILSLKQRTGQLFPPPAYTQMCSTGLMERQTHSALFLIGVAAQGKMQKQHQQQRNSGNPQARIGQVEETAYRSLGFYRL